jgi:hypothetical protein
MLGNSLNRKALSSLTFEKNNKAYSLWLCTIKNWRVPCNNRIKYMDVIGLNRLITPISFFHSLYTFIKKS